WCRWSRGTSGDLAEEPVRHLASEARPVLMRLQQTYQRLVYGLRLLPQIVNLEPGERRRPVQGLRDARHLAQVLLAHGRDQARDLLGEGDIDVGQPRGDDACLALDIGEIDIVVEAAPAQ